MGLLPQPADRLLDYGLFAVLCAASILLVNVLAARAIKSLGKGRLPRVEGVNREQRRRKRAEASRRRR